VSLPAKGSPKILIEPLPSHSDMCVKSVIYILV
jgi:hypothetical protein